MNRRPLALIAVIASLTVLTLAAVVQWFALPEPVPPIEKRDRLAMKTLVWFDEPKPAPKTAFIGPDGEAVKFSDFKGKALVVNLWATWCAPCIKELPSLDKLEEERGGPTFRVVALSIDKEGASVIQPFFETNEIRSLKIYADPEAKVKREFAPPGLPTTYLINRDGQVVAWFVGPTEWDSPEALKSVDRLMVSTMTPATASSGR
jgi:thiol-disulfide isomerase/thioredoxin